MRQSTPSPLHGLDAARVWTTEAAHQHLHGLGLAETKRTAERKLHALGLLPPELNATLLRDERERPLKQLVLDWAIEQARKAQARVLFAQLAELPGGQPCLHANDARGARWWHPLPSSTRTDVVAALQAVQQSLKTWEAAELPKLPAGLSW